MINLCIFDHSKTVRENEEQHRIDEAAGDDEPETAARDRGEFMDAKMVYVPLVEKSKYTRVRWVQKKDGTFGL